MAERPKLLYIIIEDEINGHAEKGRRLPDELLEGTEKGKNLSSPHSFRYTRPVLQSTLQLIGCKTRHAFKISKRVFEILRDEVQVNGSVCSRHDFSRHLSDSEIDSSREYSHEDIKKAAEENEICLKEITKKLFSFQKKRSTIILNRDDFLEVVCDAMSEYRYLGPNQRSDFALACKIREKKASVTILLCGTSGCGKSTLSTLLASRLGITTVVSTDSIRHMMRSFADEKQNPLLWASTYSAGEHLDAKAVAEAKARKKAKKGNGDAYFDAPHASTTSAKVHNGVMQYGEGGRPLIESKGKGTFVDGGSELGVSSKMMAVQGYKAQSEMVIDSLDRLISSWEQKCESVIVEGVHLSLNFVMGLMKKHSSIIPFMVYIGNEEKHLERFAVRAKYMTLDPAKNKYVKYIRNIRAIQDYQCKRADKHLIPKVNNTNMDKSVASIHATIFACLRRREGGESFYDHTTNMVKVVDEEYRNQCAANSIGSKGMLQILRRRGSSRQLMALMNMDGSVAKAWDIESARAVPSSSDCNKIGPVNLQFGNFGLSAWPNDIGGTSNNGSVDGLSSRGDGNDCQSSQRSSRYGSSCSSSPRPVEGAEKELVNENTVSGSDEEQDEEAVDADSEEETDAGRGQLEDELEGSVNDQSIASEEEDYAENDGNLEDEKLDSLECVQSIYKKAHNEGEGKSHKQLYQAGPVPKGAPRTLLLSSITTTDALMHTSLPETNEKNLHGRSKSLPPFFGNYSAAFDTSFPVEMGRRI